MIVKRDENVLKHLAVEIHFPTRAVIGPSGPWVTSCQLLPATESEIGIESKVISRYDCEARWKSMYLYFIFCIGESCIR